MADTISRRSVVYDILFDTGQAVPATANVEKALKNVDKGANEAEKAVKSLGDQFLQFAGIQSQIDQVKNAMTAFKVATAGVTSGMKLLKVALAATGIGALVVALGSVITYLTQTQRGMELVTKATDALGTAFNVIVDRVSQFGEGLSLIFQGKFQQGADKLRNSFKGIGDELKREVSASFELTDALDELEDRERDLILVQAQRRKQISELRIASRDETKSLDERKKALQDAINLENAILDDEVKIAKERARISDERTKAGESTDEELKANIELQARVIDLETESNNTKRRLITELNTLTSATKEVNISYADMVTKLKELRDAQLFINTDTEEGIKQYEALDEQAVKLTETLNTLLGVKGELIEASNQELQINRQLDLSYKETAKTNEVNGFLETKLLEQDKQRVQSQQALQEAFTGTVESISQLTQAVGASSEAQLGFTITSILASQAEAIALGIKSAAGVPWPGNLAAIATVIGTIISTFAQVFTVLNQAKAAKSKANAFAEGEIDIHRPGETRGKDSIPAVIMPGESVITTEKTSKYKPFLKAIHEGTLEDLIRVNYVEPALAISAMEQAQKDSSIDYSQRFYKQLLATHDGNSIGKRTVQTLERIERKIGNQKSSWYV